MTNVNEPITEELAVEDVTPAENVVPEPPTEDVEPAPLDNTEPALPAPTEEVSPLEELDAIEEEVRREIVINREQAKELKEEVLGHSLVRNLREGKNYINMHEAMASGAKVNMDNNPGLESAKHTYEKLQSILDQLLELETHSTMTKMLYFSPIEIHRQFNENRVATIAKVARKANVKFSKVAKRHEIKTDIAKDVLSCRTYFEHPEDQLHFDIFMLQFSSYMAKARKVERKAVYLSNVIVELKRIGVGTHYLPFVEGVIEAGKKVKVLMLKDRGKWFPSIQ